MAESSRANRIRRRVPEHEMAESSRANRIRRRVAEHEVAESSRANRIRRHVLEHDIFLSHSGKQKAFVEQLFRDLRRAGKHPFFDQDWDSLPRAELFPQNIVDAAEQCQMGVVVVSENYLKSYWPMVELNLFVVSQVKVLPLFFKLSPSDLKQAKVESTWKPAWRDMGMTEEVVESWGKAVKVLRSSNGFLFERYSNSEHKYRLDVVREICEQLPAILKSKTSDIQGYERLCKTTLSMFKVVSHTSSLLFEGNEYLGLYGMAGAGKSTLCKAVCKYSEGEFGANVYRVELTSDQGIDQLASMERLTRLKEVLERMGVESGILKRVSTEEEGWKLLEETLQGNSRIFLAIDNVGNSIRSIREAQLYLKACLPHHSKVLVTSRSQVILQEVLGCHKYCKPLPRLEQDEALELFHSIVAPTKSSSFNEEEKRIMERCLDECQYAESGYTSTQFNPLILKALGSYFHGLDIEVLKWEEALMSNDKLQRSEDAKNVKFVFGLNYVPLSDMKKLIFLDTVLYPRSGYGALPWTPRKRSGFDVWVSWISEVHGLPLIEARMMLRELQRLSLLEDSSASSQKIEKPYAHDLYKDFVRGLVKEEGSMEWKWWMSQVESDSGNELKLKRLILKKDKSIIGQPPKKLQEWQSLVFLELHACTNFGRDNVLELGGLNKLRVLVVEKCATVQKIICTCDNDARDHNVYWWWKKRKLDHCQGCMTELSSVKLKLLDSLEDISFLRHSPNIRILRVLSCNGSIYPSKNGYLQNPYAMDLSHLKKLHILIVWEVSQSINAETFSKWLCNTLHLQELKDLEYAFFEKPTRRIDLEYELFDRRTSLRGVITQVQSRWKRNCDAITINLGEGVSTSNLSVLSMRLPVKVNEVQGLQFLTNLTTLNFKDCGGLSKLPNLRNLPKLKEVRCSSVLYNRLSCLLPQNTRRYIESRNHEHDEYEKPWEMTMEGLLEESDNETA